MVSPLCYIYGSDRQADITTICLNNTHNYYSLDQSDFFFNNIESPRWAHSLAKIEGGNVVPQRRFTPISGFIHGIKFDVFQ